MPKSGLHGGLVDRPVALASQRLAGAAEHQHLRETTVAGAAADFLHRCLRILIGDDHRRPEAPVAAGPALQLAFIGCEGERRRQIGILVALARWRQRIEYAKVDAVAVEMLLLHEGKI